MSNIVLGSGQITSDWSISIWDAMYEVLKFIIKPFQILFSIPLGFGDASVMHFIIGIGIIGIAIFFFWRASFGESVSGVSSRTIESHRQVQSEKHSPGHPSKAPADYYSHKKVGV